MEGKAGRVVSKALLLESPSQDLFAKLGAENLNQDYHYQDNLDVLSFAPFTIIRGLLFMNRKELSVVRCVCVGMSPYEDEMPENYWCE